MLCTKIVFRFCFDIQNNICTQHVLNLYFFVEFNEQSLIILLVNWFKNKSFWHWFTSPFFTCQIQTQIPNSQNVDPFIRASPPIRDLQVQHIRANLVYIVSLLRLNERVKILQFTKITIQWPWRMILLTSGFFQLNLVSIVYISKILRRQQFEEKHLPISFDIT